MRNERRKRLNHILLFLLNFQVLSSPPFIGWHSVQGICFVWISDAYDVCRSFPSIKRGGRTRRGLWLNGGAVSVRPSSKIPLFNTAKLFAADWKLGAMLCLCNEGCICTPVAMLLAGQSVVSGQHIPSQWWSCFSGANGLMRSPLICVSSWFVSHCSKKKGGKKPTQNNKTLFIFLFLLDFKSLHYKQCALPCESGGFCLEPLPQPTNIRKWALILGFAFPLSWNCDLLPVGAGGGDWEHWCLRWAGSVADLGLWSAPCVCRCLRRAPLAKKTKKTPSKKGARSLSDTLTTV